MPLRHHILLIAALRHGGSTCKQPSANARFSPQHPNSAALGRAPRLHQLGLPPCLPAVLSYLLFSVSYQFYCGLPQRAKNVSSRHGKMLHLSTAGCGEEARRPRCCQAPPCCSAAPPAAGAACASATACAGSKPSLSCFICKQSAISSRRLPA